MDIYTATEMAYKNGYKQGLKHISKYGRWEEATDGDGVVCPVCGEDFCTIIHEVSRFKYCPNCGTNMESNEIVNKHARKFCPMIKTDCIKEQCAWWLDFAKDCSLPVATGILADSTISRSY